MNGEAASAVVWRIEDLHILRSVKMFEPRGTTEAVQQHSSPDRHEHTKRPHSALTRDASHVLQAPSITSILVRGMTARVPSAKRHFQHPHVALGGNLGELGRKRGDFADTSEQRISNDADRVAKSNSFTLCLMQLVPTAAVSLLGMMISGRMTPARICVAPEIEAFWPAWAESNVKVLAAIGIVPNPSVRISVNPTCSVPVIATPRSYPSKCAQILIVNAADDQARDADLFGPSHGLGREKAPPTTTFPFMSE